ncbi:ribbon-helix-helix protein, CopG family [Pseudonocardia sulfidoxydans]|nr:ribbon-helix-helix protein, CopG family [Pseudonocardia sulfidoxydans]
MTLRLTDDEADALRRQAEREDRSMQEVVREAVREYVERRTHSARVDEALHVLAPRCANLLDRLGKA